MGFGERAQITVDGDGEAPAPDVAETDVAAVRGAVADGFLERLERTVDRAIEGFGQEVPELERLREAGFWEAGRQMTRQTWALQAEAVRRGSLPAEFDHDERIGAANAAAGLSAASIVRIYHIGCTVSSESWMVALANAGAGTAGRVGAVAVEQITTLLRDYNLALIDAVVASHSRVRRRGTGAAKVSLAVQALLGGVRDEAPELGFPLAGQHVAAIVWGPKAAEVAEKLAAGAGNSVLATEAVAVEPDPVWWLWVAGADAGRQVLLGREPAPGARIAIGKPGVGVEGFRRSHRQAASLVGVAERLGLAVCRYEEHAVDALIAAGGGWEEFAAAELRGLETPDRRAERLRRTLEAYLATGQNAASAAAGLGLHETTVARHLQAIEKRIGRPVRGRQLELALALRVRRLLHGDR